MTATMHPPWQLTTQGLVLQVHLQPRAAQDRLVGLHGGSLKIALTAPPVDNAANTALLLFLAKVLRLPRSAFSLLSGAKSREKRVLITGQDLLLLDRQLAQALSWVDKKNPDG